MNDDRGAPWRDQKSSRRPFMLNGRKAKPFFAAFWLIYSPSLRLETRSHIIYQPQSSPLGPKALNYFSIFSPPLENPLEDEEKK